MIIWLASYPKSGNTWVRSFISSILFTKDGDVDLSKLHTLKQYEHFERENDQSTMWHEKFYEMIRMDEIFDDSYRRFLTDVIKPRYGSGSRGILIVNHKKNSFTHLLKDRFCGEGSWEIIKEELKNLNKSLDNCFVMPYHDGKTFDVDCVASKGNLVLAIPRLRVYENPLSPTNQGCIISPNKIINDYC